MSVWINHLVCLANTNSIVLIVVVVASFMSVHNYTDVSDVEMLLTSLSDYADSKQASMV